MIWARDLGTEHDRLLLDRFPERAAWVVDADLKEPKLVPFADAGFSNGFSPGAPKALPGSVQISYKNVYIRAFAIRRNSRPLCSNGC